MYLDTTTYKAHKASCGETKCAPAADLDKVTHQWMALVFLLNLWLRLTTEWVSNNLHCGSRGYKVRALGGEWREYKVLDLPPQ
jgi:hypothetical protein